MVFFTIAGMLICVPIMLLLIGGAFMMLVSSFFDRPILTMILVLFGLLLYLAFK